MKSLDITELLNEYELDSFTLEDIYEFTKDAITLYKNLQGELIHRLETGKPFHDAPVGIDNPDAYSFLFGKLLKLANMFEEDEMKFKLKKERWEYLRNNQMPWTSEDVVDLDEIDQQIDYCSYNARLTRKRIEILSSLKQKHC